MKIFRQQLKLKMKTKKWPFDCRTNGIGATDSSAIQMMKTAAATYNTMLGGCCYKQRVRNTLG